MALRTRSDHYKAKTNIDISKIYQTSRTVSALTGLVIARSKPIIGENAFAHESGIHQDGVLKFRETYEIMDPAAIGIPKASLVLGKHSGRAAFKDRAQTLGFSMNESQLEAAFAKFKALADKKKEIYDEDVESIISEQLEIAAHFFELRSLQVVAGSNTTPTATVALHDPEHGTRTDASIGDGPVDAIYGAIARLTGVAARLTDYRIRAVTKGGDAQGEVQIEVEVNGRRIRGRGVSTDILEASALAYIAAINRLRSGDRRESRISEKAVI